MTLPLKYLVNLEGFPCSQGQKKTLRTHLLVEHLKKTFSIFFYRHKGNY